jgi:N-acetylglucosaminyl-diphospho-decaprenol L-rhamnosyltransferase
MILSFVIIEYHSLNDILKCIISIQNLNLNFEYEIIVSSNSQYNKNQQEKLIDRYKSIKWSFNKYNNGFAYGMNCGIRLAKGKYIILQNPDTKIINGDLKRVFSFMEKENVGLLGPQIVNSKNEIQDSCRPFMTPIKLMKRLYYRYINGKKSSVLDLEFDYSKIQTVDWVIGGFMIIPRSTIDKVGVLSEKYFMYIEDMDYCLNILKNNLKVYYYPELVIEYEGDRKSSKLMFFNKYLYVHIKNYLIFVLKFYTKRFK